MSSPFFLSLGLPSPESAPIYSPLDLDTDLARPCKRKRDCITALPITPPATAEDPESTALLSRAVHVLTTEATALSNISRLYQTDPTARTSFLRAVEAVVGATQSLYGGKLIVCGVGKSGYIAMKIVATMKSLGIRASFLHAAEAIHGDLGDVRSCDVVLFVSFSGKTAELMTVAAHIPANVTLMALTGHEDVETCPLLAKRQNAILLPAPIHESEESTFGVAAPTTSTTVAIAIGDMLALTVADQVHRDKAGKVFKKNHPGGSIGASGLK